MMSTSSYGVHATRLVDINNIIGNRISDSVKIAQQDIVWDKVNTPFRFRQTLVYYQK